VRVEFGEARQRVEHRVRQRSAPAGEVELHLKLGLPERAALFVSACHRARGFQLAGPGATALPRPREKTELAEPELEALATRVRQGR
jgi:hypothetical protein